MIQVLRSILETGFGKEVSLRNDRDHGIIRIFDSVKHYVVVKYVLVKDHVTCPGYPEKWDSCFFFLNFPNGYVNFFPQPTPPSSLRLAGHI